MKRFTISLLLLASAIGLAGCGAGSGGNKIGALGAASRGVGKATITLKWPARTTSRLIPVASNRVVVTMKKGGVLYGAPIIMDRPVSGSFITTQTVDNLPTGPYTADAIAYPDANPASTAQAKILNQPFTVTDGATATMNLTMASAITSFVVEGAGGVTSIAPAATLQIFVAARDADNNTVLTSGTIAYSSNDTAVATVDANTGLVTGVAAGTARITVTDSESGVSGYIDVTVQSPFPSVLVADSNNCRIAGINTSAGAWTTAGSFGSGANQVNLPWGMAKDTLNRIYVCDFGNGRIVRMNDPTGAGWVSLSGAGSHSFSRPCGIALDSQNHIYVSDCVANKVVRMDDMTGAGWTEYGSGGSSVGQFTGPRSLAIGPSDRIYIADTDNNRIVCMDNMTGANWTTLTTMGGAPLLLPFGITVSNGGGIYVADSANNRIAYAASIADTVGAAYGSYGSGAGNFISVYSVALDQAGHIYATDRGNNRIVKMNDMTGAGWAVYGSIGTGAGLFLQPSAVLPY